MTELYQKAIQNDEYRREFLNLIRNHNLFEDKDHLDIYHYKVYYNDGKPFIKNIFTNETTPILIKDWNMLNIDRNYISMLIR